MAVTTTIKPADYASKCGHTLAIGPVAAVGGSHEGQWCVTVTGPRVVNPGGTNKAGTKKIYCVPDLMSALDKAALFCGVMPGAFTKQDEVDEYWDDFGDFGIDATTHTPAPPAARLHQPPPNPRSPRIVVSACWTTRRRWRESGR